MSQSQPDPDSTTLTVGWAKLATTGAAILVVWTATVVTTYFTATNKAHEETADVAGRLDVFQAEKTQLVQKRDEQMADKDKRIAALEAWKEQFTSATTVRFGQIDSKLDVTVALLTRIEKKLDEAPGK